MNDLKISVATQVAALPTLLMKELWALWDRYFPRRPEKTNRRYLEARVAHKLQEEAFGGLAPETRQRLIAIRQRYSKIPSRQKPREIVLAPGTVLLREWAERDHKVVVTVEGKFEYEGPHFKSLSAVARHITGIQWNGLALFGLRQLAGRTE